MTDVQLTKDSKELLAIIYKEYLDQINNGKSKSDAKLFGGSDTVCELANDWLKDDIVETMRELDRAGFINNFEADNTIYFSNILDKTIVYFENKNLNNLKSVAEWILKLK